jgi:hypothetical protein
MLEEWSLGTTTVKFPRTIRAFTFNLSTDAGVHYLFSLLVNIQQLIT